MDRVRPGGISVTAIAVLVRHHSLFEAPRDPAARSILSGVWTMVVSLRSVAHRLSSESYASLQVPNHRVQPSPGVTPPKTSLERLRKASPHHRGLTLVEMLVGMAITLVMMAAVVTLFANVSGSVRNRRANVELSAQLRQARNRLTRDLTGATCRAMTWQRPEAAVGYLEIIEGRWSDSEPSDLLYGSAIDFKTSLLPSSGVRDNRDKIAVAPTPWLSPPAPNDVTNGAGLGDYDDILALTVESDGEPFVGRGRAIDPNGSAVDAIVESSVAEVLWFAVESPADGSLGEPGFRTLYRRALLVAPWTQSALTQMGPQGGAAPSEILANFYRKYDISVRLEDHGNGPMFVREHVE